VKNEYSPYLLTLPCRLHLNTNNHSDTKLCQATNASTTEMSPRDWNIHLTSEYHTPRVQNNITKLRNDLVM